MKRFIKEILLENWSLKATAVLLALILWLFVRGEPGPERVLSVALEVQLPRLMEITNERPKTVEVTMRGAAFSNMLFSQPVPNCIVDLQKAFEGEHVVTLSPDNVRFPKGSGIEVLQITPARIDIVLQKTISKEVPVIVPVRGTPAQGFEIYSKQIKPSSLIISGPRSHIESVWEISTDAVSIYDQKQSGRFFVGLNLRDNFVRTSLSNPVVQVDVMIGPRRKLYTIPDIPVLIDNPAYTTTPKQISILVEAPSDLPQSPSPADFRVTIETGHLNKSDFPARMKPEIQIGKNLNGVLLIKELMPAEVTVRPAPAAPSSRRQK
jgi:YbbR domain-containing protein